MINSTIGELYYALNPTERADFGRFIQSAWCNPYPRPQEQTALLAYFDSTDAPEKEVAYEAIFPSQEFVDNKLEKLMSTTLKSLRRWILLSRREDEAEELIQLGYFYSERGLNDRHDLTLQHARNALDRKRPFTLKDLQRQLNLEYELSSHLTLNNQKKDDANLYNTLLSLDRFYLASRLKNTLLLLHQQNFVPLESYPVQAFLPALVEEARANGVLAHPLLHLYDTCFQLTTSNELSSPDLNGLLEFLDTHADYFDTETLDLAESAAGNYCIRQYNASRYEFLPITFQIVKRRVESGRLYTNGTIPAGYLHGIVIPGLRLREFEWVRQFLDNIKGRIIGVESPEDAWNYFYARYLFGLGQYEEAQDYLALTTEKNYFQYGAKVLEIQLLYEIDQESTLLDSKLDAAKVFFFRDKKLPAARKALYNDFLDMLRQIRNPKTLGNRERVSKLIEKVHALPGIAEREWVLEKLTALLH